MCTHVHVKPYYHKYQRRRPGSGPGAKLEVRSRPPASHVLISQGSFRDLSFTEEASFLY